MNRTWPALSLLALTTACGGDVPTEINGSVANQTISVASAFWGGPFILLSNREFDCTDMAWVERTYDQGETPIEEDMTSFQVTFNDAEVSIGTFDVTGEAPVSARVLTTSSGAFGEYDARTGSVIIDEFTNKDEVIGSFELGFDQGDLDGTFQVEFCTNLKG